jgi:NADPH:quinone reductase-like Zn-dependent oxidoreductase
MSARAWHVTGKRTVALLPVEHTVPGAGEMQVRTEVSALSAGTERLLFRDEVEGEVALDAAFASSTSRFPLRTGYSAVGRVTALGAGVDAGWLGARVFAFRAHQDVWNARVDEVLRVPDDVPAERAALLANLETAVSLVMDGAPLLGESVAVVGLGVVGQFVTAILSRVGLGPVLTDDARGDRLELAARAWNAKDRATDGEADLVFELTGQPEALPKALALARREGRVVVGSWYGTRSAPLSFGTQVHRGRQTVLFSQVAELASGLTGRFTKERRFGIALDWLRKLPLEQIVTHRIPFTEGERAWALLDTSPEGCLQIVLTYRGV